jgi:hypothetical protein
MRAIDLPGGKWLEPAAGSGALVRGVLDNRDCADIGWTLCEARGGELCMNGALLSYLISQNFAGETTLDDVQIGDFLTLPSFDEVIGQSKRFDVCIGNPPYSLAQEFAERAIGCSRVVAFLLRLNFLGSQKRAAWLRKHTPSVYVLPRRPSFTDDNKTDACEYAWFLWGDDQSGQRVAVLDPKDCED